MNKYDEPNPPIVVERKVITDTHNYKEVSLPFRKYRFAQIEHKPQREDRLHCPMLDASRSDHVYGVKTLRNTTKKDLIDWAEALGSDNTKAFLIIAYLSGPVSAIPTNIIKGRFNEAQVNTGLITRIKDGINTGILNNGRFNQSKFDEFICAIHPQFNGTTLNEGKLYTDEFSECYVLHSDLEQVLAHNLSNKKQNSGIGFLGKKISEFEMGSLLFGLLSQPITGLQSGQSANQSLAVDGMLVRDLFDLYKYGWFPAHIEEAFIKAGLISNGVE